MSLKISDELVDSSETPEQNHDPVPFTMEIRNGGITIKIPQDGEHGCSVAEIYLEHYAGKIRLYAWDKDHFLNSQDPMCSLILLDDSGDRTMP